MQKMAGYVLAYVHSVFGFYTSFTGIFLQALSESPLAKPYSAFSDFTLRSQAYSCKRSPNLLWRSPILCLLHRKFSALLTNCAQERDYAVWNGREQEKKTPFGVRRKLVSSFLSLMRLRKGGSGLPLPLFLAGKAWPNCSPISARQMSPRSRSAVCAAPFGTVGFPIR